MLKLLTILFLFSLQISFAQTTTYKTRVATQLGTVKPRRIQQLITTNLEIKQERQKHQVTEQQHFIINREI